MTEISNDAPERAPQGGRRSRGLLLFLRDAAIVIVIALVASFLIKTFLVRSFYIPSGSMEDTLQVNDRILVNELVPNVVPIARGDVVVFEDPGGWLLARPDSDPGWFLGLLEAIGLAPSNADDHLVKRVIGLPGDHVVCCNALGQITINDVPIQEPYLKLPPGQQAASTVPFDVTVPDGFLWVLGDNRDQSSDSRYHQDAPSHGFVPMQNVVGRAFAINWPLNRIGWLENYPAVFGAVPDPRKDGG